MPDAPHPYADALYSLLAHLPAGTVVASTSQEGTISFVNVQFTAITGYTREDVPTTTAWLERAYPDPVYRAEVIANWSRDTAPAAANRDVVYRVRCADGSDKHLLMRAAPLADEWMVVMVLDVSRQRQIERQLRASEERFRALVESSPDGIIAHTGAQVVFANSAAARMVGATSPSELVDRPVMDFVHPDFRGLVGQRVSTMRDSGQAADATTERFLRLDGTPLDVEVAAAPVELGDQQVLQVVFRDVTERVALERERRVLDHRMQEAQRLESLGTLAGGVAHDFNNLLQAILGNVELAQLECGDESSVQRRLLAIETVARRATELATQMLAYSGRGSLESRTLDLSELVESEQELVEAADQTKGRVDYELAPDVPAMQGDETQLRQVVLNLVNNAAEALGDGNGRITVRTGTAASDDPRWGTSLQPAPLADGCYALLEVHDEGHGMDRETLAHIFEPFFSTRFAGRGLGLAAAAGIVRGHHGTIRVQSELGRGTTFRVLLPAVEDTPTPAPPRERSGRPEQTGEGAVLVVDDEPVVLDSTGAMVEQLGFTALLATDGAAALRALEEARGAVRAVVLDRTMPGLSGLEVLAELDARWPDLPVVLCSGYDSSDLGSRATGTRPTAVLKKPFRMRDLEAVLREVLAP